jgi:26S proteasome regulatory subunit N8
LPTQAFITQEEVNAKTGSIYKSFFHIESRVEATEPEEIGVEHLLREIKEIPLNSLESSISQKVQALRGLGGKI